MEISKGFEINQFTGSFHFKSSNFWYPFAKMIYKLWQQTCCGKRFRGCWLLIDWLRKKINRTPGFMVLYCLLAKPSHFLQIRRMCWQENSQWHTAFYILWCPPSSSCDKMFMICQYWHHSWYMAFYNISYVIIIIIYLCVV